ncbi:hypothetical protein [Vibrio mediterranei]|uniref:hypothetical protein n=1 Tax=Vibrio mediterranei TaxID=689 RepID=UPI004067D581
MDKKSSKLAAAKSRDMVNAIAAGDDVPPYDTIDWELEEETYRNYANCAVRLCAHLGASEKPFRSIRMATKLNSVIGRKNTIKIFGSVPGVVGMERESVISMVQKTKPLLTEVEKELGVIVLPSVKDCENINDLYQSAVALIEKLTLLSISSLSELSKISNEEMHSMVDQTIQRFRLFQHSPSGKARVTYFEFLTAVAATLISLGQSQVRDPDFRNELVEFSENECADTAREWASLATVAIQRKHLYAD